MFFRSIAPLQPPEISVLLIRLTPKGMQLMARRCSIVENLLRLFASKVMGDSAVFNGRHGRVYIVEL